METVITLIVFIIGFIVGALVTRNNTSKVNRAAEDAEVFASQINRKIDSLRDEVTAKLVKKPAKRGRPATKK
jgi:uncharacterized membrane-anchored protein YhcB (DUF1043 family)